MEMTAERFRQILEEAIPFNKTLGLKAERIEDGRVAIRMPYHPTLVGDVLRPALHGGAIAALIDATAGAAAFTKITLEDRLSTIDLRIDYLRPAGEADLIADAEVRRLGNRVAVVHVVVTHADDPSQAVAEGKGVFNIRRDVGLPGSPPKQGA